MLHIEKAAAGEGEKKKSGRGSRAVSESLTFCVAMLSSVSQSLLTNSWTVGDVQASPLGASYRRASLSSLLSISFDGS